MNNKVNSCLLITSLIQQFLDVILSLILSLYVLKSAIIVSNKWGKIPGRLFAHVNQRLRFHDGGYIGEALWNLFSIVVVGGRLLSVNAPMKAARFLALEVHDHSIVLLHDKFLVGVVDGRDLRGDISEGLTRLKDKLLISIRNFTYSQGTRTLLCNFFNSVETHQGLSGVQPWLHRWVCTWHEGRTIWTFEKFCCNNSWDHLLRQLCDLIRDDSLLRIVLH